MKKLSKFAALSVSGLLATLAINNAQATSYQVFADINFSNPAELNKIKQGEFLIGGMALDSRFHINATVNTLGVNTTGTTTSHTYDFLPYGRLAMRLSPKWVVGIDVTQPYFTDIQYPRNSFINNFATETFVRDTNISPKASLQVTDRFAVGLGFDANHLYNGQLNFVVPPFGNMVNRATSWAYGWDAGIFYVLSPITFLSMSYYAKIVHHAQGTSTWGPITNNAFSADLKLPATTIVNLVRLLTPVWALSGTVRFTQWNTMKYVVLQNTAIGVITIPDFLYNNASYEIATHYQINNNWGAIAAVDYEPSMQPTFTRSPGLPSYTRTIPAVGVEYEVSKGLKAKLIYAHVFSKAPLNMAIATGQRITGHSYLNVDAWDLSFTYDV